MKLIHLSNNLKDLTNPSQISSNPMLGLNSTCIKGLKPHKCKYCEASFSNVSNKLAHQRSTHEGIKRKK